MINYSATYTDLYQLTMAQVYFQTGRKDERAVFDYFFRKPPFKGGYTIFAGLEDLLNILQDLRFTEKDLQYLKDEGFPSDFVDYLEDFRFTGHIYSSREGDIVFPTRPVLQVEAGLVEAQIIETLLLNVLNIQSLVATKASRMKLVAGDSKLSDFGLRRAHGPGGYYASRASVIGGFDSTSNVMAGSDFDVPIAGTMAHSFVQSYDDELSAFRDFAKHRAEGCTLLVDTYNTLKSGVPNAIKVGREMEDKGHRLNGIRLDSGDLAYLAKESRKMLDEAGLEYVKIAASNQLDEHVIKSLKDQGAPIDLFGVGTSLVTGSPDAALDGVYKLSMAGDKLRIKLSESINKVTLPGKKQVYRLSDENDQWIGADLVAFEDEGETERMYDPFDPLKSMSLKNLKKEALLQKVMENGERLSENHSLKEITEYSHQRLEMLPDEYKRFENPHIYKVGISESLKKERQKLIENSKNQ